MEGCTDLVSLPRKMRSSNSARAFRHTDLALLFSRRYKRKCSVLVRPHRLFLLLCPAGPLPCPVPVLRLTSATRNKLGDAFAAPAHVISVKLGSQSVLLLRERHHDPALTLAPGLSRGPAQDQIVHRAHLANGGVDHTLRFSDVSILFYNTDFKRLNSVLVKATPPRPCTWTYRTSTTPR
jgi:hypothetical protein